MTAFSRKTVADSPNQRAFVEEPHTPFYRSPVLPRRPLNSLALGWLDQVHALIPPAKYCGKPGPYWGPCIGTKAVHQQILSNKFLIVRMRELQWRREDCRRFYREHEGRFFYQRLVEFMASGPIRAYILAHKDAIQLWRTLMGPTRVFRARHMAPDSIRGSLGLTDTRNTTHGSDSVVSASREIAAFFPDFSEQRWYEEEEPQLRRGPVRYSPEEGIHCAADT
ncbi:nucleoside diphosphate kinase 6 isoform X3 [Onychomys torridus]|uniref:nucleoside diphosphate kinase 6 isoform X3 n=1 Tax=Onychomys torridus TaxID=38674 RepID=UPI00167F87AF|nr:nucleoside diphosphate kinase 6 isoform X3 [Onychomys torridus]